LPGRRKIDLVLRRIAVVLVHGQSSGDSAQMVLCHSVTHIGFIRWTAAGTPIRARPWCAVQ
jgi:hypothetical protein